MAVAPAGLDPLCSRARSTTPVDLRPGDVVTPDLARLGRISLRMVA